jgi:hypothetical protein
VEEDYELPTPFENLQRRFHALGGGRCGDPYPYGRVGTLHFCVFLPFGDHKSIRRCRA